MKKIIIVTLVVLFAFTVAYAAEVKQSTIETNVKNTQVNTLSGLMGGDQDVNVGGVDISGKSTKVVGSTIKTNVKDTQVNTLSGLMGGDQTVNVGGVKVK